MEYTVPASRDRAHKRVARKLLDAMKAVDPLLDRHKAFKRKARELRLAGIAACMLLLDPKTLKAAWNDEPGAKNKKACTKPKVS